MWIQYRACVLSYGGPIHIHLRVGFNWNFAVHVAPADHFQAIGQSVFNNYWSNIHDFDRGLDMDNWSLLPSDTPPVISLPLEGEFSEVGLSLESEHSLVPLTVGYGNKPEGEVSTDRLILIGGGAPIKLVS